MESSEVSNMNMIPFSSWMGMTLGHDPFIIIC